MGKILKENLLKNKSPGLINYKNEIYKNSENIQYLIETINNLINVIELRIILNEGETKCIQVIKNDINEIKKTI
tara:strand:+ start:616 stop:837 length:222 start_codon:yes stop_codon:yes gene_type:complete